MRSYGAYEAHSEIGSASGSTVYSAQKIGETTDAYAIKVYSLERLVGDNEETYSELGELIEGLDHSFTSRTALQKQAGENSRLIAPILDSGQDERGTWYATRFYPRSLEKIIAGHIMLGRENLFHVLRSVVRAALELKHITGRSHANLKTSNVLIGGAGKITEGDVVLSDPLPGGVPESARYEQADLRAIGEILLQLVRRREITDSKLILPIELSAQWIHMFCKHASAWLGLCNRLLDPNLSAASFSLEQLDKELETLKPKARDPMKALALAATVILLGLSGALVLLSAGHKRRVSVMSQPPAATLHRTQAIVLPPIPVPPGRQSTNVGTSLAEAPVGEASVVFRCNLPAGETILLNERRALADYELHAPSQRASLRIGHHEVTAKYRDAPPIIRSFEVIGNQENTVDFNFDHGR